MSFNYPYLEYMSILTAEINPKKENPCNWEGLFKERSSSEAQDQVSLTTIQHLTLSKYSSCS